MPHFHDIFDATSFFKMSIKPLGHVILKSQVFSSPRPSRDNGGGCPESLIWQSNFQKEILYYCISPNKRLPCIDAIHYQWMSILTSYIPSIVHRSFCTSSHIKILSDSCYYLALMIFFFCSFL